MSVQPANLERRRRIVAALRAANGAALTTPELCQRAGFNNFEHHAYVLPQLRALVKLGIITRSPVVPGAIASWALNRADQADRAMNERLATDTANRRHA
ncbi:hypothetical protein PP352_21415 [Mycobacteroides abscessus]|nr:hypothetical protein [Mycobacteroides abscessus]